MVCEALSPYGQVEECNGLKAVIRVPRETATRAAAQILGSVNVEDVTIEEPPIEAIVSELFGHGNGRSMPPQGEEPDDAP